MEKQDNNKQSNRSRGPRQGRPPKEKSEYDSKVLDLARVVRVTKGGKRFSFRATVVIGNKKGKVGVGVSQGSDVAQSVQKASNQAKRFLLTVPITKGSIPHIVEAKYGSAYVLLKPAAKGNGLKAGGPVRAVVTLAGIEDLTAKLIKRTRNKINIARATMAALEKLKVTNN
ncbi:MAG: 30S ribosomal protein S5 [Candidatus Yanofskybacteria bacterium CG10_big_fil_rev_8_21_14_0_10_36_16]|uniref:Small ribosomal subunit protein uS5 n=1 Tax=Candidatus Yanofskybacteria bacterium CG10_big_fil_rev_8_21_14_0_10_36_16 TaxID=1975096 RepID=A0A2J0QB21_9BACT|nr:MAG: 30S ribosomal protein S5 [Candidatus Yanofskybacteria bacterium CG10_big_fil_rev_8_21_14_0_10_36_16]